MDKNHFCLNRKSNAVNFKEAIEELKLNLKLVVKCISDEHVKFFLNEYKLEEKYNLKHLTWFFII